jgi:hypothetical protein
MFAGDSELLKPINEDLRGSTMRIIAINELLYGALEASSRPFRAQGEAGRAV